jgi:hypothetical protein
MDRYAGGEESSNTLHSGEVMLMPWLRPAQQNIRIDENAHLLTIAVNTLPAYRLIRKGRCMAKVDDRFPPGGRPLGRR